MKSMRIGPAGHEATAITGDGDGRVCGCAFVRTDLDGGRDRVAP
jgi:hypothetical protein